MHAKQASVVICINPDITEEIRLTYLSFTGGSLIIFDKSA